MLPGLVDCHTHLVADATVGGLERAGTVADQALDDVIESSLRAHARAGVTTVRDLGDRRYRTLRFRHCDGLPRVVASGPPLTTPGGHCHFLGGVVSGDARAAVAEHAEHGVDVIKVMASGGFATPDSDCTSPVSPPTAHVSTTRCSTRWRAEACTSTSPWAMTAPWHARMPAPPPPLAALMATLGVTSVDAFYRSRMGVLSRLREHGVTVVCGVDSGMAPPKAHGNAWRTVAEMVEAGYETADALAAATSVAAQACGLGSTTGRLAAGYAADLLLVDGDLASDVSLLGMPREVVVRGARVGPA